jgi:hypothetical protein
MMRLFEDSEIQIYAYLTTSVLLVLAIDQLLFNIALFFICSNEFLHSPSNK